MNPLTRSIFLAQLEHPRARIVFVDLSPHATDVAPHSQPDFSCGTERSQLRSAGTFRRGIAFRCHDKPAGTAPHPGSSPSRRQRRTLSMVAPASRRQASTSACVSQVESRSSEAAIEPYAKRRFPGFARLIVALPQTREPTMAKESKRNRSYAAEYQRRIARGLASGKSRAQARGHARAIDLPKLETLAQFDKSSLWSVPSNS